MPNAADRSWKLFGHRGLAALAVGVLCAAPAFAFVFGEPLPPLPPNPNPNPNPVTPGGPTPPPDLIPPGIPLPPPSLNELNPPDASVQSFGDIPPDENRSPSAAPEPATLLMGLAGVGCAAALARWRRRQNT
jgi:hypothetical protein